MDGQLELDVVVEKGRKNQATIEEIEYLEDDAVIKGLRRSSRNWQWPFRGIKRRKTGLKIG